MNKSLEVMQNDALRVIFKKSLLDQISSNNLREWAGVESIAERQKVFLTSYYDRALTSNNTLIKKLFDNYYIFKRRNLLREDLSKKRRNDGRC